MNVRGTTAQAQRTWERTLERLADGYERVLGGSRSHARAAGVDMRDRAA